MAHHITTHLGAAGQEDAQDGARLLHGCVGARRRGQRVQRRAAVGVGGGRLRAGLHQRRHQVQVQQGGGSPQPAAHPAGRLATRVSLDVIDGTKNVPFIPAARYLAELRGNFLPKGKSVRNLYVSLESDYTFKQNQPFTGYNTETATGDYWVVNASIGTDIANKGKTIFSIHFSGMNLGDVAYQNHLSRLKYTDVNNVTGRTGVFNIGRNFGIKVNVPLDFKWN